MVMCATPGSQSLRAKVRDFSAIYLLPFWRRNVAKRMLEVTAVTQSNLPAVAIGVCAGPPLSWNENLSLKL
jgi:hypothetical protein